MPKQTLHNWLKEQGIRRPQTWQPLVKVASALRLTRKQAGELLAAAQHPTIDELLAGITEDRERSLLARWATLPPNNLPSDVTSFVGRTDEISRIIQILLKARLVTLIGPGGIGKTRLALRVARSLLESYRDGVWFVDLAPVTHPSLVLSTVAHALGVRSVTREDVLEHLQIYLRNRHLLLLLDNFEHLLVAAPHVVALLRGSSTLTVLVTSRKVLHVSGEHHFHVPALPLPEPTASFSTVKQSAPIKLFSDRAQAVEDDFILTESNAGAVVGLCRQLDGLPLGIELAAARSSHLQPREILTRFSSRLDLGSDGPQDVHARHQSLRSLISWSYDLLDPTQQTVFRRLAVFVGGWTGGAAQNVVHFGISGSIDVPRLLASLVEQSLVRRYSGVGNEVRYGMLETIREFAHEELIEHAESETLRQRHAAYYAHLGEIGSTALAGPEQVHWVGRLTSEQDNFRTALQWAIAQGNAELALRLAAALGQFWNRRGYVSEGRHWLAQVLGLPYTGPTRLRAEALNSAGMLAHAQNDFVAEHALYTECLTIYRELDDQAGMAHTVGRLGLFAQARRLYPEAKQLLQESLGIHRQLGDKQGIAFAQHFLAVILLVEGELKGSLPLATETLELYRELGDVARIAASVSLLGLIALYQGDIERAKRLLQDGLNLHRAVDETLGISNVLMQLGFVELAASNVVGAKVYFRESLSLQTGIQDQLVIGYCLDGLTEVALRSGEPERAARLAGAAHALRERLGLIVQPADRQRYDEMLAAIKSELEQLTWEHAWTWGRTLSLGQTMAEALVEASDQVPSTNE
ncbi:MAG: AAA family ATPase [Chloroflexota bacterium]|nr:AAA family ATPase [Chloroflexota bacterium]